MPKKQPLPEYETDQMTELIRQHIHSERDRLILSRRLIDGITFEKLAEEFDLSTKAVRIIVHKQETILFRHIPG